MTDISKEQIEVTAQAFWKQWKSWRLANGWRLGPDRPDQKMSPDLLSSWFLLEEDRKDWFRQHTALVLYASDNMDQVDDAVSRLTHLSDAIERLNQCEDAIKRSAHVQAIRKLRSARKILLGK